MEVPGAREIHADTARADLHREDLGLAILPALQFVAPAGQFEAAVAHAWAGLVDGIQVRVEPAEDHHRLLLADIFQRVRE